MIPSASGRRWISSEVGLEERVDEHDEDGAIDVGLGEADRVGGPELLHLLDVAPLQVGVAGVQVVPDLVLEVARDTDDLVHADALQALQHVVEHGSVAHPQQRLGAGVGEGPEPCTLSGQRYDGLHCPDARLLVSRLAVETYPRGWRVATSMPPPPAAVRTPERKSQARPGRPPFGRAHGPVDTRGAGAPAGGRYAVSFARVWDDVVAYAGGQPRWALVHSDETSGLLTLVCRSRLFRFVDDLSVWVSLDAKA